ALLATRLADPSSAAFWPLAEFSPEWQAIRWSLDHAVEVRPIDVPVAWTLDSRAGRGPSAPSSTVEMDPLAALAHAAGEPDAERWWEDVVEHRGDGVPAFAAVASAMEAVRAGVTAAGTDAVREAHMR